ncbi:MAG: penicillin-binding transpeptidase domain-containing protein [Asticcacaulis sp.]
MSTSTPCRTAWPCRVWPMAADGDAASGQGHRRQTGRVPGVRGPAGRFRPRRFRQGRHGRRGHQRHGRQRRRLNLGPIQMAGKTGTAQSHTITGGSRATLHMDWEQRDHAWFVAFAPADKPKYAMSVIVQHGGLGAPRRLCPRRAKSCAWLCSRTPKSLRVSSAPSRIPSVRRSSTPPRPRWRRKVRSTCPCRPPTATVRPSPIPPCRSEQ